MQIRKIYQLAVVPPVCSLLKVTCPSELMDHPAIIDHGKHGWFDQQKLDVSWHASVARGSGL